MQKTPARRNRRNRGGNSQEITVIDIPFVTGEFCLDFLALESGRQTLKVVQEKCSEKNKNEKFGTKMKSENYLGNPDQCYSAKSNMEIAVEVKIKSGYKNPAEQDYFAAPLMAAEVAKPATIPIPPHTKARNTLRLRASFSYPNR